MFCHLFTSLGLKKLIHKDFYYIFFYFLLIYLAKIKLKIFIIISVRAKAEKARVFSLVNIKNLLIFKTH